MEPRDRSSEPLNVLITGASSGIGEAVAHEYARRGARLALFARRRERLAEVAARCKALGARETLVLPGDTTVRADVDDTAGALEQAWPRLDRAYLNAGTSFGIDRGGARAHHLECCSSGNVTAADFSADVFEHVMKVNVIGVVYWLEPLFRRMRAQGAGTIAVTGSLAADRPLPRSSAYSTSKTAIRALVESLRYDACRLGIQLCLIEPGFVETADADPSRYVMPFLEPVDRAAARIFDGVESGARVIRFPWQASWLSRLIAVAPRPLYEKWVDRVLENGGR